MQSGPTPVARSVLLPSLPSILSFISTPVLGRSRSLHVQLLSLPFSNPSVNIGLGALVKHINEACTYGERHARIDTSHTRTHTHTVCRWILWQCFQHKVTRTYACQRTLTIKGQIVMGDSWVLFHPSTEKRIRLNKTFILQLNLKEAPLWGVTIYTI